MVEVLGDLDLCRCDNLAPWSLGQRGQADFCHFPASVTQYSLDWRCAPNVSYELDCRLIHTRWYTHRLIFFRGDDRLELYIAVQHLPARIMNRSNGGSELAVWVW